MRGGEGKGNDGGMDRRWPRGRKGIDSPSARSFRLCNPPSANTELISRELAPPFRPPWRPRNGNERADASALSVLRFARLFPRTPSHTALSFSSVLSCGPIPASVSSSSLHPPRVSSVLRSLLAFSPTQHVRTSRAGLSVGYLQALSLGAGKMYRSHKKMTWQSQKLSTVLIECLRDVTLCQLDKTVT